MNETSTAANPIVPANSGALPCRAEEELIEAKQALERCQHQLDSSLALLQATLDSTADGIMVMDLAGQITAHNLQFGAIWGIDSPILRGHNALEILELAATKVKNPAAFLARVAQFRAEPEVAACDVMELLDGRVFEQHSFSQQVGHGGMGIVLSLRDVTERIKAESALRRRELELQSLLDGLFAFVAVVTVDGHVAEINRAPLDAADLRREDVVGAKFSDASWWNYSAPVQERLDAAIRRAAGGEVVRYDEVLRIANDERATFDGVLAPLRDEHGVVTKVIMSGVDVTDRMRAETALVEARTLLEARVEQRTRELASANSNLKAEVAERQMAMGALRQAVHALELAKEEAEAARAEAEAARAEAERANGAKSEFLSRMSHELRTPLNAILGFGQVLEMEALTGEQRESVEFILRGGEHLLGLINEVLDISRVESGRVPLAMEMISVADAVRQAMDLARPLSLSRKIVLQCDLRNEKSHCVLADPQLLKQVLLNLLANGIKYNRQGGKVSVGCFTTASEAVRIEVRDTGFGIAPADLEKLFVPFERLGAEANGIEGTGLGLMLSRRLTEAMGGVLGVASEVGVGSLFYVEFHSKNFPPSSVEASGKA